MGKVIKNSSVKIYKGMSLFRKERSPYYWGYLNIDGIVKKKSLGTDKKNLAEKFLFEWKSELMTSKDSPLEGHSNAFSFLAKKLIQKEKQLPPRPSGVEQWTDTQRLLSRTNGLLSFFGNKDINSITTKDIEDFFQQLPLNNKPLTTSYLNKHKNLLKRILESGGKTDVIFPNYRGKKSSPRGYFSMDEYKKLRDGALGLIGTKYNTHNGTEYTIDAELHSFIIFMGGSMLRPTVSEIFSLKFEDIEIKTLKDTNYLEFPITRKNRKMVVQTLSTSFYAYEDILERRPNHSPSDYLFAPQYENRRTAMRHISNMFSQVLRELKMTKGKLGEERTCYSLRHSSLIFNLSQPNVDLLDISRRADTSMKMIQDFYYPISQLDEKLGDFLRV